MSVSLSPNLPANVVEIGNEISQAKINEINAGTLALQSWVSASYLTTASASSTYQTISGMSSYLTTASASSTYAPKASPTFTGTVTIPAGASISGYATQSYVISSLGGYATTSFVTSQGYLTDAPSNGSEYVRKNGAWSVATGGGGGGVAWGGITGTVTDQTDLTTYIGGLGYQTATDVSTYVTGLGYITSSALTVTNIDLTGNFNGYSMGSGFYTFKFDSSANTLRMQNGSGSGITISPTAITFPDSSTISTAPVLGKSINTLSGSYTLGAIDTNNIVYVPVGAGGGFPLTISFPEDITYNFPVGTVIMLVVDNTVSGTNIIFSTTGAGSPFVVGSLFSSGISSSQTGQWFMTKLAPNYWIIS